MYLFVDLFVHFHTRGIIIIICHQDIEGSDTVENGLVASKGRHLIYYLKRQLRNNKNKETLPKENHKPQKGRGSIIAHEGSRKVSSGQQPHKRKRKKKMNIKDECENEPTKPAKYVNVNDQGRQRG